MHVDQWLPRCHVLNDRIMPALSKRLHVVEELISKVQSKVLRDCYLEVWIHTLAAGKISTHYISLLIEQLAIYQAEEAVGKQPDALGQELQDTGVSLALDSLESLAAVIEISSFHSVGRVLKILAKQIGDVAVPWLDVLHGVKEIIDALGMPTLSEADKVLLELEAYQIAVLEGATWAVGQVSALTGPHDLSILDLPLDEAAKLSAAAARAKVDDVIRDVRPQLPENISQH